MIENAKLKDFKRVNIRSWNDVSTKVKFNLINAKNLCNYKNPVYKLVLDLALTYIVFEAQDDEYIGRVITHEDLKRYKVTEEELHKAALFNMEISRHKRVMPLSESMALSDIFYPLSIQVPNAMFNMSSEKRGNNGRCIVDVDNNGNYNVLSIKNKHTPFGASYLCVMSVMNDVYEKFNKSNFYILPISRHEIWAIKAKYATHNGKKTLQETEDDLLDFIEEYNDTANENWEDILSYKIYYYMGDDGRHIVQIS